MNVVLIWCIEGILDTVLACYSFQISQIQPTKPSAYDENCTLSTMLAHESMIFIVWRTPIIRDVKNTLGTGSSTVRFLGVLSWLQAALSLLPKACNAVSYNSAISASPKRLLNR